MSRERELEAALRGLLEGGPMIEDEYGERCLYCGRCINHCRCSCFFSMEQ